MGLKSDINLDFINDEGFAPYMGLKSIPEERKEDEYTFAPYMGLKSFMIRNRF